MADAAGVWATGAAYEPYVGRWSRLVAREFLGWLGVAAEGRWLDVGCGTGILTRTILEVAAPGEIVGIDPSDGFVGYARTQANDRRVRFEVGDARSLPFDAGEFDAVVAGLVLNFVPDPNAGVAEMRRVARAGGTVAAYVWDYAGRMQMMRAFWDAAGALDPAAIALDEGRRFSICNQPGLTGVFVAAGLRDVAVHAIDVPTVFRDFDDYWSPFLGGTGPAPNYLVKLDEERRAAVRERIRQALPAAADGSIHLSARAWAVRGTC